MQASHVCCLCVSGTLSSTHAACQRVLGGGASPSSRVTAPPTPSAPHAAGLRWRTRWWTLMLAFSQTSAIWLSQQLRARSRRRCVGRA